jgi:quercetin dioxygenase-like cupin family protein
MERVMRTVLSGLALLAMVTFTASAWAQATTRLCTASEEPGPACLLSHQPLPSLPTGPLFWHLDQFPSKDAAGQAASPTSTTVEAFGSIWLFTIERAEWRSKGGKHVASVGPLPIEPASTYSAEYLRSIFKPGTIAPLHVHSGPEAFYAVSGDTCLETPDGVQIGRGPGNSLLIKGGPPMLLMAIGNVPRQGFALILHDASRPPTTLTDMWHPQGLCAGQLAKDQVAAPAGG